MKKYLIIAILLILITFGVNAQSPTPAPSQNPPENPQPPPPQPPENPPAEPSVAPTAEPTASYIPSLLCGNGRIDSGEDCDISYAADTLNGKTCEKLGFVSGILSCYPRDYPSNLGCKFNTIGCLHCKSEPGFIDPDCIKKLHRTYCSRDGNIHADSAICNEQGKCEPGEIEKCDAGCVQGVCVYNDDIVNKVSTIHYCNPNMKDNPDTDWTNELHDQCPDACYMNKVWQGFCNPDKICTHTPEGERDCEKEGKICIGGDCRKDPDECETNQDCPGNRPHCASNVEYDDKIYAGAVVSDVCEQNYEPEGYLGPKHCTGEESDDIGESRIVDDCKTIEIDGTAYDYPQGYCVSLGDTQSAPDYCDGPPIDEEMDGPCTYVSTNDMESYDPEVNNAYYCSEDGVHVYQKQCTSYLGGTWRKKEVMTGTRDQDGDYKYCFAVLGMKCKELASKEYTTKSGITVTRSQADCVEEGTSTAIQGTEGFYNLVTASGTNDEAQALYAGYNWFPIN